MMTDTEMYRRLHVFALQLKTLATALEPQDTATKLLKELAFCLAESQIEECRQKLAGTRFALKDEEL